MNHFTLNNITITQNGSRVQYEYTVSKGIKKYFNLDKPYYAAYDQYIGDTPPSLLVIPLLANIMPISWFVGFDVHVNELDATFHESLKKLKEQFLIFHPGKELRGELHVGSLKENTIGENNTSLLYSGGLDSYDSLIRNIDKNPFLISIHGADVKIADTKRWNQFKKFNSEETIVNHERLFYIESNLREFYTYKVELLAGLGWWGSVQHGMALLGVLAPLSHTFGLRDVRIAASATHEVTYSWGSSPKIDENMKWANTTVTHDGYDQRRTDKIDNVVAYVKESRVGIKLRVCYAEARSSYNCSTCHKCQRTMLSLILSNADPADYGFIVPENLYEILFKNFNENTIMTVGILYQWTCLQDKAKEGVPFFVIKDKEKERKAIDEFANLNLGAIVNKNEIRVKKEKKLRFILKQNFPRLFKIYAKLRH
ncbi:hypothetical protein WIW50_09670 [Flavobacteriaceae bacterium 3-367]|uniref:hypothetical protein n=1 Tax=Eudoraea algarum TaxID=3417568 RepID=UPI0032921B05